MKYHERSRSILAADLPAPQKLTLLALADHADPHGRCWPSMSTLARETSLGLRTVQRAMQGLRLSGLVSVSGENGSRRVYTVALDTPARAAPPVTAAATPARAAPPTPVTAAATPARAAAPPVRAAPPTERAKNDTRTGQSSVPASLEADPIQPGSVRFAALVARYSAPDIPTARRWKSKPAMDLDWFAGTLLPLCPPDFDVLATFAEIDLWIEGQLRQGGRKAWKPGGWKGGIRRWVLRDIARHKTQPANACGQRQAPKLESVPARWLEDADAEDCRIYLADPRYQHQAAEFRARLAELEPDKPTLRIVEGGNHG